jgi:hypothetical protein
LGLFDELKSALASLDLNIADVRGQAGYDNGSNMKGKHQGVQTRMLEINPRALYMACACHSLNLTLYDMGTSCRCDIYLFYMIQYAMVWKRLNLTICDILNLVGKLLFFWYYPAYIHIVCKIYQKVEFFC